MSIGRLAAFVLLGVLAAGLAQATGPHEIEPDAAAATSAAEEAQPAVSAEAAPAETAPLEAAGPENVARATITTSIVEREPGEALDVISNDQTDVFYFTEIQNLTGRTVTHRWEYGGNVMAEVELDIGSPRWRTYSSKKMHPGWLGVWTVSVLDESGNVMSTASFDYITAGDPTVELSSPAAPQME
jgi:hypothetical protein